MIQWKKQNKTKQKKKKKKGQEKEEEEPDESFTKIQNTIESFFKEVTSIRDQIRIINRNAKLLDKVCKENLAAVSEADSQSWYSFDKQKNNKKTTKKQQKQQKQQQQQKQQKQQKQETLMRDLLSIIHKV